MGTSDSQRAPPWAEWIRGLRSEVRNEVRKIVMHVTTVGMKHVLAATPA